MAHDLKNPIGTLANFLLLITENINEWSIDIIESRLKSVVASASSTYGLLEELLTWQRAHSGKIDFKPKMLPLSPVWDRVFENVNLLAKNKNISLTPHEFNKVSAFADKQMLHTVLRNLISNAIKFTNNGGAINVYAKDNGVEVQITVTDNGVGMDAEVISKLFDDAHHVSTKGTENEKGTGIGLLLCKELVETHAGKIWVDSELKKGSEFIFTLPNPKV